MRMLILEGTDGSGKTTQVDHLATAFVYENNPFKKGEVRTHAFPTRLPQTKDKEDMLARVLFYLDDFRRNVALRRGHTGVTVYDRSFVSTLVYQGFQKGVLKDPVRYESILSLGAEAFFGDTRLSQYAQSQACFCYLTCSTEAALKRMANRHDGRPDEVESLPLQKKREFLDLLRRRYDIVFADLRSRLGLIYPNLNCHFVELDTSDIDVDTVTSYVEALLETLLRTQTTLF